MTKNNANFLAEAARRDHIAQNEKAVRAGKLFRIGDGDYLATAEEVAELKADLFAAGFELAAAGTEGDERIYMPDCRTTVGLTRIQRDAAAPAQAPIAQKVQVPVQQHESPTHAPVRRQLETAPQ